MRPLMNRMVLSAFVLAVVTTACDQPSSNTPAGPTPASATGIDIIGPSTVPPGTPTQYTTNVRLSDGRSKVTLDGDVTWRITGGSALQVSASGLVTPVASQGEGFLNATVRVGNITRQSSRELVIVPNGTFRVVGRVVEQGAETVPVVGARVEVDTGAPFALTDVNGNYRLYGVSPSATLRVTAPSYTSETVPLQLSTHTSRNFVLAFTGQRMNLAGNYTLTLTAPSSCGSMPAEFRNRQYEAVVSQTGVALDVRLTAPNLRLSSAGRGDRFSGTVTGSGATFSLPWSDYYYSYYYSPLAYSPTGYPSIVETVSGNRYLVTYGRFTTVGSSAGLTASSGGSLTLWNSAFPRSGAGIQSGCFGSVSFRLDPR